MPQDNDIHIINFRVPQYNLYIYEGVYKANTYENETFE